MTEGNVTTKAPDDEGAGEAEGATGGGVVVVDDDVVVVGGGADTVSEDRGVEAEKVEKGSAVS